jgi:hypothetical protein
MGRSRCGEVGRIAWWIWEDIVAPNGALLRRPIPELHKSLGARFDHVADRPVARSAVPAGPTRACHFFARACPSVDSLNHLAIGNGLAHAYEHDPSILNTVFTFKPYSRIC